jgi:hypothetical protein
MLSLTSTLVGEVSQKIKSRMGWDGKGVHRKESKNT